MKSKILIFSLLLFPTLCFADSTYINGRKAESTEIQEFVGLSANPGVSTTNKGRVFYQASTDTLQVSLNGGAYATLGGGSVSDTAYDATSWDNVTDEAPSKNAVRDKIETLAGGHDAVTLSASADTLLSLSTQELGLDTQTANRVFSGPATGDPAVPTFRALVDADIPDDITITESDPSALKTAGTDNVKDTHIDWGTGAGQVSIGDLPDAFEIIQFTFKSFGGTIAINTLLNKISPCAGTITAWRVISDTTGSITFQVNKSTTASPDEPSFAEISGTEDPALSSAFQGTDTSLSSWTATVARGDSLQVKVTSETAGNINGTVRVLLYITRT